MNDGWMWRLPLAPPPSPRTSRMFSVTTTPATDASFQLSHFHFCLLQSELHFHLSVHRGRGREVVAGLLALACQNRLAGPRLASAEGCPATPRKADDHCDDCPANKALNSILSYAPSGGGVSRSYRGLRQRAQGGAEGVIDRLPPAPNAAHPGALSVPRPNPPFAAARSGAATAERRPTRPGHEMRGPVLAAGRVNLGP